MCVHHILCSPFLIQTSMSVSWCSPFFGTKAYVCVHPFLIQTSKSVSWCSPFLVQKLMYVFTLFRSRLARSLCLGVHLFWHNSWHSEKHMQDSQLCIFWGRLNKRCTKISNKFSLLWAEGPEHSLGWYSHFVKIIISILFHFSFFNSDSRSV